MNPDVTEPQATGPAPAGHLLVVERPIGSASTAYALKIALGRRRRGEPVVIYLTDSALDGAAESPPLDALDQLSAAGARIFAVATLLDRTPLLAGAQRVALATEDDLAALLLTPGIDAKWS